MSADSRFVPNSASEEQMSPLPPANLSVVQTPDDLDHNPDPITELPPTPNVGGLQPIQYDIDTELLNALASKDRVYVLKLAEFMETLIADRPLTRRRIEPATTYQRLLIHRCSTYYNLSVETDPLTKVMNIFTTPESQIPPRRLADLAPPLAKAKIAEDDGDVSDVEASDTGSFGEGSTGTSEQLLTIEDRTAAYHTSRKLIFTDLEKKQKSHPQGYGYYNPPRAYPYPPLPPPSSDPQVYAFNPYASGASSLYRYPPFQADAALKEPPDWNSLQNTNRSIVRDSAYTAPLQISLASDSGDEVESVATSSSPSPRRTSASFTSATSYTPSATSHWQSETMDVDSKEPNMSFTSQIINADGTPKRPMNAFMIFARRRRPQISAENPTMRTGDISKILSQEWKAMLPADKQFYLSQAKGLKESFNTKYPDYVYRRRPNNTRKRRRPEILSARDEIMGSASLSDAEDATVDPMAAYPLIPHIMAGGFGPLEDTHEDMFPHDYDWQKRVQADPEFAPKPGQHIFDTDGLNLMGDGPHKSPYEKFGETAAGTFVIYSPDEALDTKEGALNAKNLPSDFGIGRCSISVHEPVAAVTWIENNWGHPLLTSFQNNKCDGPLPMMLLPTKPALALFGSYDDPFVTNAAQSLTTLSGLPVVIRPSSDNPARALLPPDCDISNLSRQANENNRTASGSGGNRPQDESSDGMEVDDPGSDPEDNGSRHPNRDGQQSDRGNTGEGGRTYGGNGGGGGDGDDGGGGTEAEKDRWESPLHRTRLRLRLKLNTNHAYAITIGYKFKFKINGEADLPIDFEDLSRSLSQPEVVALVDFKIETRPRETQVDRSYANIGFVAHRKESIVEREFLHRGFDLPDKLYKRGRQEHIQRGLKASLGFSSGSPMGIATFSYNRNRDSALEATDSKIMPRCRVDYENGDEWDEDRKSYTSYNIAYQQQDMQLDPDPHNLHPLEVKVGMGINLRPAASEQPLPKISFINRNQVLIWVVDPTSKTRVRGIVVLMSSYLDNIRTEEKLSIYEQEEVNLMDAGTLKSQGDEMKEDKPGTISLSIAKVQDQAPAKSNRFGAAVPAFIAKLGQRPRTAAVDIPPHEYLARGWDATNNQWRNVLWPALDQDFRAAAIERTAPVWNIEWKRANDDKGKKREE